MMMRSVSLREITQDSLLAGRARAEVHLSVLIGHADPAGAVVLDFAGIEVLTSSYFFGALWPFWTREDANGPSTFPLVANTTPEVDDEIRFAMSHRRMGAWHGCWDGRVFTPDGWVGALDDGLSVAITRALDDGSVSAVELSRLDQSNPTAWNNRLVALHKQRLLLRRQTGRKQIYFVPWEEAGRG